MTVVQFLAGLVLLIAGAESLVRGAAGLARLLGVPSIVVALTVVAYGTGSPELAITLQAVSADRAGLAVGNLVGSNIANVLLILGVAGLLAPIAVKSRLVRIDVPIMIALSVLVVVLALDGGLGRIDGALLVFCGGLYTWLLIRARPREPKRRQLTATKRTPRSLASRALLVLVGLGLLVLGARWLVDSATELARALGLSDLIIGLTLVALGTSLPELATTTIAVRRGERDIAVGNAIGSNIVNLALILGLAGLVSSRPLPVPDSLLHVDLPIMLAASVACLPIFFTGWAIARWEAALFVGYYCAYLLFLTLDAASHDAAPAFNAAMLAFVIPVTVLTLAILSTRALGEGNRPHVEHLGARLRHGHDADEHEPDRER
ncbi:MAG: calcium/sodium antiporter [Gaiellaceae bacterium]